MSLLRNASQAVSFDGPACDATSGALYGSSRARGILYEINKATGAGSNGRPTNNGSDYEPVDCLAHWPSVIADLFMGETVDDATRAEGTAVHYSITVRNAGPHN